MLTPAIRTFDPFFNFFEDGGFYRNGSQTSENYSIHDDEGVTVINVAIPGVKRDDIKLNVEGNFIKLDIEQHTSRLTSRYARSYSWEVTNGHSDDISAKLENGILEIRVPKFRKEVKVIEVR